jgi:hypothetical protein
LATYLMTLPHGLASYPDVVAKGAVFRQFAELVPRGAWADLPSPLREAVRDPPPVSAWVPETWLNAMMLAAVDLHYQSEASFVARAYETNVALLRGPIYRILMLVVSPATLLRGAETRWSGFHRGIRLRVSLETEHAALMRLDFPPHLVPRLIADCYATGFRAAVEAAGGKHTLFERRTSDDRSAVYAGSWL